MENKYLSPSSYPDIALASSANHDKTPTPFTHKYLKNSLEDIVSQSNSKNKSGPLEDMLSDKVKSLKASVVALLEEIKLREDLNTSHLNKMNDEILNQHNELMHLENVKDCYPFDLVRDADEARVKIKDNVLELERELRSEGLECWRDLMFLKKYLMGSLKDYWELVRRRQVLGK